MLREGHLAHIEAFSFGQHRNEPREISVERQLLQHLSPEHAHPGGHIFEVPAHASPNEQMEELALQGVQDGRPAPDPPGRRHIRPLPHDVDEREDPLRTEAGIRGKCEKQVRAGHAECRLEHSRFSHALAYGEDANRFAAFRQRAKRLGEIHARRLDHEEELEQNSGPAQDRCVLLVDLIQGRGPLGHRDDHGDIR